MGQTRMELQSHRQAVIVISTLSMPMAVVMVASMEEQDRQEMVGLVVLVVVVA